MGSSLKKGRVAVVLSGGGARGAFEIGVLKALGAHGIEPDIYCGTSVGSFNCAMAAAGRPLGEIEQVWLEIRRSDVYRLRFDPLELLSLDPRPSLRLAVESVRALAGFLRESLSARAHWWQAINLDELLLDTSPLLDLISRNVNFEALRKSDKELYVALTRLKPTTGVPLHVAKTDEITDRHILASCSLPLIFPHVTIGDNVYCDGGIIMNSPLKPAVQAGADQIYIVDLTPTPRAFRSPTLPLAYQILSTQFSQALRQDIEYARNCNHLYMHAYREGTLVENRLVLRRVDPMTGQEKEPKKYRYIDLCVIQPRDDTVGIEEFLDFSRESAEALIRQGERIAKSVLSSLELREVKGRGGATLQVMLPR
ncbi:MAG TPA: patatin-like phospholipase family protein [Acidobacteriota bacterium]|nr:patatin-like phospholipase family protein [Acidobacteriota bacterium]